MSSLSKKYVEYGWAVLPVYSIDYNGECTCLNTKCHSPGKHPLTRNGLKEATKEISQIELWCNQWPQANIGIATGKISNLFVLDVDPKNGGLDSLEKLLSEFGSFPETLEVETGGEGLHYYFIYPTTQIIRNSAGKLGSGLDIRGDGGYVLAPPSNHVSGGKYQWSHKAKPAHAPMWLLKKLNTNKSLKIGCQKQLSIESEVIPGQRNSSIASIAGTLLAKNVPTAKARMLVHSYNNMYCKPSLPSTEVDKTFTSILNCELAKRRNND